MTATPTIDPEEKTSHWEECYVTVQTKKGPESIKALRHTTLGAGLAVTGFRTGYFCVTHIATGLKTSREWERCVRAMLDLLDLAQLADWTQDGDGVKAEVQRRAVTDELVVVHGNKEPVPYKKALGLARGDYFAFCDEFPWEDSETDPWAELERRS